jgi:sporulation protein YlmC with PRC-barrel domain
MSGEPANNPPALVRDAALHLLDRQMVDSDGRLAGKVDDIEFTDPEPGESPILVAFLTGPGALANRFGGKLGRFLEGLHRHVHPAGPPGPWRVPMSAVRDIGDHVQLAVPGERLGLDITDAWFRDHLIAHIPGARHEVE